MMLANTEASKVDPLVGADGKTHKQYLITTMQAARNKLVAIAKAKFGDEFEKKFGRDPTQTAYNLSSYYDFVL